MYRLFDAIKEIGRWVRMFLRVSTLIGTFLALLVG
jgi:hypothetical protein